VKSIVSQNSSATAVYISPTVAGELDLWVANNSVANNALSIIRNGLSTGTSGAYIDNVITSTTFNQYPTSLITANQSILVAGAGASFLFGTENNAEDLIIIAGSNAIERIRVSGTSGQAKFSYPVGINMTASSNNWIDITTSGTTRAISILQTNGGGASAIKCDATSGSGAVGFHFIQRSSGGYGGWFEALNDGTIPFQIKGTATQTANLMQVSRGTDYGYETFVIKGDGNVGISVPVPLYTLHVSGTPYTSNDIRVTAGLADITAVAQGVGGGIAFTGKYNAGGVQTIYGFVKGIKESAVSGEFAGALVLGTTNQNAPYFFERLRIASTGQLTANYYTTAGILHNAVTTGLISSSLIVAADVTNNTLTNTQLANLVAVGTIPMGATYGLTASAITQAAGKLIGIDCTPNNKFVVSNGGNLGLEVDPASYSDGVRVFAYQRGSGPGYKNILLSDGGGGVSIGTVTNYAKLDIGTSQNVALRISSSVTGNTGTVEFINASNYGYGIIGNVSGTGSAGGDVYGLGYSASNNSSFTSVLRWTSGGNVGIGCTPAAGMNLDVNGKIAVDHIGEHTAAHTIVFDNKVGIGGVCSMSNALDVYSNSNSSNTLYLQNVNTSYGTLLTFPKGWIGEHGADYGGTVYGINYANLFRVTAGSNDTMMIDTTGPLHLICNILSISQNGTNTIASFGYGGTGISFPYLAPGAGSFLFKISTSGLLSSAQLDAGDIKQATTAGKPTYVKGDLYFDTTLNKLRIGGATAWETITSV
jgi:hypothetical protein